MTVKKNNLKNTLEKFDHLWVIKNFSDSQKELKKILQKYLENNFVIEKNKNGKPFLKNEKLFFSVSHSEKKLFIAISDQNEIGVDAEKIIARKKIENIFEKYFSNAQEKFSQKNFYFHWTAREAFVKNIGETLMRNLKKIIVKKDHEKFLIGKNNLSHEVIFLPIEAKFCVAICREIENQKPIKIFS